MKLLLIFAISCWTPLIVSALEQQKNHQAEVVAAFNHDCAKLLISNINQAKKTIYGAIYSLTSRDIAKALIAQSENNVKIYLKIDKEQGNFTYTKVLIKMMQNAGIKIIYIPMKKGDHMHNKFAVIDKQVVITGSFNWTLNASKDNYENIVSIKSEKVADQYIKAWKKLK